jgi:uncharacterized membrane protein
VELLTALGLAVPAGLNAYVPLLAVAAAQRLGWMQLGEPFSLLGSGWMIAILSVLLVVEIVADKVPGVDHVNDALQTLIRPAAGGVLAVAAAGGASGVAPWLLVLAGVLVAGGVHAAKATTRPVVHATTAGAGGPLVSAAEDATATVLSVVAILVPVLVILLLAGMAWGLWRLLRRRRRRQGGAQ